jgi:hypothetical protein
VIQFVSNPAAEFRSNSRLNRLDGWFPRVPGVPGSGMWSFYLNLHWIWRHIGSGKDEVPLIGDDPFNVLALGEFHGLSKGRGEVDVILLAGFAINELDFGVKTHGASSRITRRLTREKCTQSKKCGGISS